MAQKDVAEKMKNIKNEAEDPSKAEMFSEKSLYSTKSFMELQLSEELQKGIYCLNYQTPSKVQEAVLNLMIGHPGRHLIFQSPPGTGKTAAFLLAAFKRVNTLLSATQVIILSPLPELTLQIADVAERMVQYSKITTRHVMIPQHTPLKEHLIIGTPAAMAVCDFDETEQIVMLVIDEADWIVRSEAFDSFLEKLSLDSSTCQVMLFSDTYDKQALEFADRFTPSVKLIKFDPKELIPKNISQYYAICNNENEKYSAVSNILGSLSIGQTFIFCSSKGSGKTLEEKLAQDGHSVWHISDEMTVFGRAKVMKRFKTGKERILVVENLVIRGVDIPQVTLVINYDLPYKAGTIKPDYKSYLHRVGRTGRFGRSGLVINLINGSPAMRCIKQLECHFGCKIKKIDAHDTEPLEKIEMN